MVSQQMLSKNLGKSLHHDENQILFRPKKKRWDSCLTLHEKSSEWHEMN